MSRYVSYLKRIDVLGEPVSLTVDKKSTYQTYIGALFSVVFFCTFGWGVYFFFLDYIDTTSPSSLQIQSESRIYPKFNMYREQVIPPIFIADKNSKLALAGDIRKYGTFVAIRKTYDVGLNQNVVGLQIKNEQIEIVKCSELPSELDDVLYGSWNEDSVLKTIKNENGLCLKPKTEEDFTIEGKPTDDKFSTIKIVFLPCLKSPDCIPITELVRSFVSIAQNAKSLNISNKYNPITIVPKVEDFLPLSPSWTSNFVRNIKTNRIQDSSGTFSKEVERAKYLDVGRQELAQSFRDITQFTCTALQYASSTCLPYITIEYFSSGTDQALFRTYTGILDTLGNIGGLKEVIMIVFAFIYSFYHDRSMKKYMINKIYDSKGIFEYAKLQKDKSPAGRDKVQEKETKEIISKMHDVAEGIIEENLDTITIVKEINRLKVLVDIFMKPFMRRMAPFVCLNEHRKKEMEYESTVDTLNLIGAHQKKSNNGESGMKDARFKMNSTMKDDGIGPEEGTLEEIIERFIPKSIGKLDNSPQKRSPDILKIDYINDGDGLDEMNKYNRVKISPRPHEELETIFIDYFSSKLKESNLIWRKPRKIPEFDPFSFESQKDPEMGMKPQALNSPSFELPSNQDLSSHNIFSPEKESTTHNAVSPMKEVNRPVRHYNI